ncbi:MAG: hypothetical protein AB7I41_24480 [Candidatus Sericytochromatia bacterium]
MYDTESIRYQIEEAWANHVVAHLLSQQERANAYKIKKIMLQAHASQSYFEIEFEPHLLALSHEIEKLSSNSRPLEQIGVAPIMIGLLGGMAEILGLVSVPTDEEIAEEKQMDEDMFFTQHFTSSLSDALGGLPAMRPKKDTPF